MKYLTRINREADSVAEIVLHDVFTNQTSREFNYEDAAILGLLENIINQVKSLQILAEHNHHTSADVILRAIFENFVYLKFILEKDTALRGKAYHYSIRLSEFEMIDKLMEQSLRGRKLRELVDQKLSSVVEMYESKTDSENRHRIETEYLDSIGMQRLGQKWYNLDMKTNNLKKLCCKLGLEPEYELIYSILSKEAHGKDAIQWFELQRDFVAIKKSSNYKDNLLHVQLASLYLIQSVKAIYEYYRLKNRLRHFNTMLGVHKRFQ